MDRARLAGQKLGADIDIAGQLRPFEAHRWQRGDTPHPTLQLDDVSGIPFLVDVAGVEEYQHRGRLRAAVQKCGCLDIAIVEEYGYPGTGDVDVADRVGNTDFKIDYMCQKINKGR